jgi:transposase
VASAGGEAIDVINPASQQPRGPNHLGYRHIVEDLRANEIGLAAIRNAVTLVDWYLNEACRLQHAGRTDPRLVRAAALLEWLRSRPKGEVSVREILPMRQIGRVEGGRTGPVKEPAEKVVKDIRRATRRQLSAEEKIRFVLEGLRSEESIAELCRREGIVQNLYYRWSKDFLEAGASEMPASALAVWSASSRSDGVPAGITASVRAVAS